MKLSDRLDSLLNDALRNNKPEVASALRLLRDGVHALEDDLASAQRQWAEDFEVRTHLLIERDAARDELTKLQRVVALASHAKALEP